MANLTSVTVTAGVPTAGTGTVSTLDNLIGTAGTASAQVQSVQGIASMTPLKVDGSGVTQPISASALPLPTGAMGSTGGTVGLVAGSAIIGKVGIDQTTPGTTNAVAATLQASATTAIGTVNPNTIGNWGLQVSTQNSATPTNGQLSLAQFNTTPTTITSGNVSPLQTDANGNLLVNIKAGAGSGGTALADEASFTEGTTSFTPVGGTYKTSQTALTSGQAGAMALDANRNMMANVATSPSSGRGTFTTGVTRPANTTAYSANSYWANSTSAPTSGGFTFTSAGVNSGGSGIISDILILSSVVPATLLQGELHIFDQAVTAGNDAAAWSLSDTDALNRIGVVPFSLLADTNNSYMHAQNLNIGFTCVGTANLRFLVKVTNAYTPASAEVLTFRLKARAAN
jgi:hypothetical protein